MRKYIIELLGKLDPRERQDSGAKIWPNRWKLQVPWGDYNALLLNQGMD